MKRIFSPMVLVSEEHQEYLHRFNKQMGGAFPPLTILWQVLQHLNLLFSEETGKKKHTYIHKYPTHLSSIFYIFYMFWEP